MFADERTNYLIRNLKRDNTEGIKEKTCEHGLEI